MEPCTLVIATLALVLITLGVTAYTIFQAEKCKRALERFHAELLQRNKRK